MGSRLCDAVSILVQIKIIQCTVEKLLVENHHKTTLFNQETKFFSQTTCTDTEEDSSSPESWLTFKVSGTEFKCYVAFCL